MRNTKTTLRWERVYEEGHYVYRTTTTDGASWEACPVYPDSSRGAFVPQPVGFALYRNGSVVNPLSAGVRFGPCRLSTAQRYVEEIERRSK